MNHQTESSNEPRIIGFESKPIPIADSTKIKTYALIGVGIAFALFLLFSPGIPTPGSAATMQKKKYVAPKRNAPAYKSAEDARTAVQNYVDQQMKKNDEFFRSFKNH